MRDGAEDNPRKATLVFKGRTLASRAQVLITQNGDKYRDVKEYTAGELAALADETVISVPSAIGRGRDDQRLRHQRRQKHGQYLRLGRHDGCRRRQDFALGHQVVRLAETRYGNRLRRGDGSVRRSGELPRTGGHQRKDRRLHLLQTGLRHRQGRFQRQHPHRFGGCQVLGQRRGRPVESGPFRPDRPYRNRHRLLRRVWPSLYSASWPPMSRTTA